MNNKITGIILYFELERCTTIHKLKKKTMQVIQAIQNRIYEIRGERVMIDFDLASLYEVETKVLNQAVKRNIKRFPEDFMFRLTLTEWQNMRSQIVAASENLVSLRSQIVTASQKKRNTNVTPYAFTEQGVAMLSGILNSDKAINMNIAIMRAFVEVRKVLLRENDLKEQMKELKLHLGEHDAQLSQIYDAMENLLDEKASQRKWNERQRIGFKKNEG
jgi:phage regulator Rha-like protein